MGGGREQAIKLLSISFDYLPTGSKLEIGSPTNFDENVRFSYN